MSGRSLPKNVTLIIGRQSEAVQVASIYSALVRHYQVRIRVVLTGEEGDRAAQCLESFSIAVDQDLRIRHDIGHDRLTTLLLEGVGRELADNVPDLLLVSGQSLSAFCAGLAAYQLGIPVAHVQAGVRSGKIRNPPPEESQCVLIDAIADLNFVSGVAAREHLISEGVEPHRVVVSGNPAEDSVEVLCSRVEELGPDAPELRKLINRPGRWIVATCDPRVHSEDERFAISAALRHLAIRYHDLVHLVCPLPVHPDDRGALTDHLASLPNVHRVPPLSHADYVWLASRGAVFVTDGHIGRSLALHHPRAVLRQLIEGPQVAGAEVAVVAEVDKDRIVEATVGLLESEVLRMASAASRPRPRRRSVGERIAETISAYLEVAITESDQEPESTLSA